MSGSAAPDGNTPPNPDPASTPPVKPATPPVKVDPSEPQTFSVDYVRELRAESKGYRLKLSESESQKADLAKERDNAKADADKRVSEANAVADQRIIRAELKASALKAGMVDLDGLKLADLSKVKLNDKGEVEGAEALMEEMKKSKPYLFGAQSTSSTANPPPPDTGEPKKAKDMTAAEYSAGLAKLRRG